MYMCYESEEMHKMGEKFNELTEERKKYFIFLHCLNAENIEACKNIIELFDKENILTYSNQIILGQVSKSMEDRRIKLKDYFNYSQQNYKNILKKFSTLVNELKLTNSLEISILFTYLMWNGYFSKDQEFNYQIEKRALIDGMYSYDIMNGNGVCLNFSDMLKDILIECGYNSSILLNKIKNIKEMKKFYVPEIERNIVKSNNVITKVMPLVFKPIINKVGNHAFNLIEENGKLYIYDATNLLFLELNNTIVANILAGNGDFKLTPYFSYLFNGSKERAALDTLHTIDDFKSPYSRKDYIITSENCVELFNKNNDLFKAYYWDIYNDITRVADSVEDYKENKKKILKSIK